MNIWNESVRTICLDARVEPRRKDQARRVVGLEFKGQNRCLPEATGNSATVSYAFDIRESLQDRNEIFGDEELRANVEGMYHPNGATQLAWLIDGLP